MSNALRRLMVVAAFVAVAMGTGGRASAGPPRVLLRPGVVPVQPIRLGFIGTDVGIGIRIDHVQRGSIAHRVGLERHDVIVRVNGHRIHGFHHYHALVAQSFDHVHLLVKDHRTGHLVPVVVHLHGFPGHLN